MRFMITALIFLLSAVTLSLHASEKTNTFRYLYAMAQTANNSLVQIETQKRILEKAPESTNLVRFRQSFLLLEEKGNVISKDAAAKMNDYLKKHPAPIRFVQRKDVSNYRILSMQADSIGYDKGGHFILYVNTAYALERQSHGHIRYQYCDSQRRKIGPDFGYSNAVGRTSCFLSFEINEYLARMAFIDFYK